MQPFLLSAAGSVTAMLVMATVFWQLKRHKPRHNDAVASQVADELADSFLVADCERLEKRAKFMSTAQKENHRDILRKRLKYAFTKYEAAKAGAKS